MLDFVFSSYFTGIKRITFEEFLPILHAVAQKCPKKPKPEEFFEGLKVFDKDGYGVVLSGELRHVLTSLGKPVFTFKYLM
jgi:Ca2+-binding EF-hand superfamily protein